MNNNIWAIVFLMAGTLLTTTAVTTIVPAVYAEDDHDDRKDGKDGNKLKAEDNSAGAIADCDDNDVKQAGFDCIPIAVADIELDLGGGMDMASAP